MFTLRITPGSPAPIYQQITTQLRHAISTGAIAPGELLPSVRVQAEQLLVNPNTVAKAYADLSRDGLLETLPGKGLAVAPRPAGVRADPCGSVSGGYRPCPLPNFSMTPSHSTSPPKNSTTCSTKNGKHSPPAWRDNVF